MDQLVKFVNNLNAAQRAVIIGGFSILFVLLIGLLVYSNIRAQDKKLNYTIASNLTKNQVMLAGNELEASAIPFSVIGSGNSLTLRTSKEYINIAKIKLVTSEAATSKHVGWEIFEKSSLGTTNFENNVKFLRATEGELARSLESLSGVLSANVKIAIPKNTIFTERKSETTASAVLSLKPGVYLTQKQIDGIKNFISSAVPDLKIENIKLIDQDGSLLQMSSDDMESQKSFTQEKYKQKLEKNYEKKIVELLEPVVGAGRVVARVTMQLDFKKRHIQQEIYDPEGTIRSQQTTESESSSAGGNSTGGTVGVENNIQEPDSTNGADASKSNSSSSKNITNYEISKKVIEEKNNNYSQVKKVSAAVTFDSSVLENMQNKDEFLSSIESIVRETVGYDEKRGDKVAVRAFKFVSAKTLGNQKVDVNGNPVPQSENGGVDTLGMVKSILKDFSEYFQYLIAAILLFIFYKRFIVNHEVVVLGDRNKTKKLDKDGNPIDGEFLDEFMTNYENDFDSDTAQGRLKAKVKSQIMNNIEGLDEESAAKYEVLIETLDKEINDNPEEVARMIDLLLTEGSDKFK